MQGREGDIEAQIRKRIIPQSITQNDIDFYIRKTRRLEADNSHLTDELNKIRVKLKRAQEYPIKYELSLSENTNLKAALDSKEQAYNQLRAINQKLTLSIEERTNKNQEWTAEKRGLLEQIEKWTVKAQENQVRRVSEVAEERKRADESIKRQILQAKKNAEEQEEQLKFEIRQLKKVLNEKETVQTVIMGRVEKVRREKDEQISRLNAVIEDEKQQRKIILQQKDEEINRLKEKFQKMINFQLQNIKKNLEDQGEVFSIELNGLKEIIAIKNDEISKLLSEMKRQAGDYSKRRDELMAENALLKDQVYKVQRQGELELTNLREKLLEIQAADINDLQKRYQQILDTLRKEKELLEQAKKQDQRLREALKHDFERNVGELNDKIREREQRITTLMDRIRESGQVNNGQLRNLHQSFHKIEVQKQSLTSEYQQNITFMTQQISKLTTSNQVKNAEIKKLYEELHQAKTKFQHQLAQINQKNKQQRKQREEEKQKERIQKEKLLDSLTAAERDFKSAQRRLLRQKEKEEREKNKLKFLNEELERDIQRLNKYIKSLDENLKNEYKKSQLNILDGDGSRREATARLQKQKVELETLKNIQVDQIRRKYEIDSARLLQQNERLKTELLNKAVALEGAEAEVKRLDYNHRNLDKINREKLLDYEKKMATLNNEVNLTQQLYKVFLQTKAKKQ